MFASTADAAVARVIGKSPPALRNRASVCFVDKAKNPYIPRAWRNLFHSLAREGNADELGMKEVFSMLQKRKRTVEIAAAHAESIALVIERDDRRNDQVEFPRRDHFALPGFFQAVPVADELAPGGHLAKSHGEIFLNNGHENALFHSPCAADQRPGVHLFWHRQVTGNELAAAKPARPDDSVGDLSRCPVSFDGTESGARRARSTAQLDAL